jgi:hypothetical protein
VGHVFVDSDVLHRLYYHYVTYDVDVILDLIHDLVGGWDMLDQWNAFVVEVED